MKKTFGIIFGILLIAAGALFAIEAFGIFRLMAGGRCLLSSRVFTALLRAKTSRAILYFWLSEFTCSLPHAEL